MAQEVYFGERLGISAPSDEVIPLALSNTVDLPNGPPNRMYVGTAGDMAMQFRDGNTVTIPMIAGYHDMRPRRVLVTGTTADDIYGLYDGLPEVEAPPAADWVPFTLTAGDLGGGAAGWLSKLQSEAPDDFGSISNEPTDAAALYVLYYNGTNIVVTFQGDVVDELNQRVLTVNGVEAARIGQAALDGSGFKTEASFDTQFTGILSANGVYEMEFALE